VIVGKKKSDRLLSHHRVSGLVQREISILMIGEIRPKRRNRMHHYLFAGRSNGKRSITSSESADSTLSNSERHGDQ
jgi:hypothetical protein